MEFSTPIDCQFMQSLHEYIDRLCMQSHMLSVRVKDTKTEPDEVSPQIHVCIIVQLVFAMHIAQSPHNHNNQQLQCVFAWDKHCGSTCMHMQPSVFKTLSMHCPRKTITNSGTSE